MGAANRGKRYAGLTDNPYRRWAEHGWPRDWVQMLFIGEQEARDWERLMLLIGCVGGPGGAGWHYGYTYTITAQTTE